jgi:hypothetical protein
MIPSILIRGVVVPDRGGNVLVRVEYVNHLDRFSDLLIHAWPERDDRREFTATVTALYLMSQRDEMAAVQEICKDAVSQANWMPPVWCAEWCPFDNFTWPRP